MKNKAQFFQTIILILGLVLAVKIRLQWTTSSEPVFLVYLGLSALTALLRMGVPTVAGAIPIGFILILASLVQLPLHQTMLIGITSTVIHGLRTSRGAVDWLSIAFQTSVLVLGIEAAHLAFHRLMAALPHAGMPAALPLAGTILFLVTAFPLAATAALAQGEHLRKVWQNNFLWSLPYYLAGAALAGLLTAVEHLPVWETVVVILPLLFLVHRAYSLQVEAFGRERLHAEELASLQLSMVEALALAVESKDIRAVDHLHRMAVFSVGVGRTLGLRAEQLKALRAAAVLHDIGQVAIPDHIIMKPARLTAEEFERLKVHPDVGADILERAKFPYPVAPIVRAHHERWDGSGYPRRLKGLEIPVEARILSAVDTLVALSSERHHRRALPLAKAMDVLHSEAGRAQDPTVVAALAAIYVQLDEEARSTQSVNCDDWATNKSSGRIHPAGGEPPSFLATIAAARREEQSLLEFTQILGSSLHLQETLSALARRFSRQIPYDTMVLFLVKEGRLESSFIEGERHSLFNGLSMNLGEGLSGVVASQRKPVLNADPAQEPISARCGERDPAFRSALAVPLDGPNGVLGTLSFYSQRRNAFSSSQLSLILAIAPKLALTVENSMRFREAQNQATFDFLTGLPNAGSLFLHLQNELARCARTNTPLAVLVCDLDGFKQVNDRFGHLTGNKLLQQVALCLKEHCREYDFVARMGGDEFVLVLPGATEEAVNLRRRRLCQLVESAGLELCGDTLISLSMGAAYYPQGGRSAEEMLAHADGRMYDDKAARKAQRRTSVLEEAISFPASQAASD